MGKERVMVQLERMLRVMCSAVQCVCKVLYVFAVPSVRAVLSVRAVR